MQSGHIYYATLDKEGRIIHFNEAFRKAHSSFQNIAGTLFTDTVHVVDRQLAAEAITKVLSAPGETIAVDLESSHFQSGKWEFLVSPDDTAFVQVVGFDITSRKILPLTSDSLSLEYQTIFHEALPGAEGANGYLTESEKRFRNVIDSAPVMIWMSDANNRTSFVNETWVAFTGVHVTEIESLGWENLVHPEDVAIAVEGFNNSFEKKEPTNIIYRLKTRSGDYRWVMDRANPRLAENGNLLGYISSVVDIHDQKLREEQLNYQATILENVSDIIVSSDIDGTLRTWNRAAEEFYGYRQEDVIGRPVTEVVKLDYQYITREEALQELFETGVWKGEVAFVNKKGQRKYLLNTVTILCDQEGKQIGVVTLGINITDRKLAEYKLQQSELFYRNLISNSLDGMLITNKEGVINYASPGVKAILQYDIGELMDTNAFSYVHPEDIEWAMKSFQNEVTRSPEIKSIVIRLRRKSGQWVWCMVRGHNLLSNPYIGGIVIYFHDDTLRKEARDALKASEQRFRNLIRDLRFGVMLLDNNGKAVLHNNAILELADLDEWEVLGKTIGDTGLQLIAEDDSELQREDIPSRRALVTKQPVHDAVFGLYRKRKKDWVWLLVNADPILNEENEVVQIVCTYVDITERKRLQKQLLDQEINKQKMLTQATIDGQEKERREIGKELHDNIGQQLTTTKLYLDMACSQNAENSGEMLGLASRNILGLINEIRQLSRSLVPPSLKDLGLVDSVKDLCQSFRGTQQSQIRFYHNQFDESSLAANQKLMVFRIVQEQLNNIIRHAAAKNVIIRISSIGAEIRLVIADNGRGFDTSKNKAGLGLVNIINRAELFNGKVEIRSAPGEGCSLSVIIPVRKAAGFEL